MNKKNEFRPVPGRKWMLEVRCGNECTVLKCIPPVEQSVQNEYHENLAPFNEKAPPYGRTHMKKLAAAGCSAAGLLVPGSAVVKSPDGKVFREGEDYIVQERFGTFMLAEKSAIAPDQELLISYRYVELRLDSVVKTAAGTLEYRPGISHVAIPHPPPLKKGEKRLANIFFKGHVSAQLTDDMIYPVVKRTLPKTKPQANLLPKTMKKLKSGKKLRILVWGDSVTECTYLPEKDRYQHQFLKRLKKKYPDCPIEMRSFGWGGRNTQIFLAEPPGSKYNYEEQLLAWKPDLVISEFVNDGWYREDLVNEIYGKVRDDLRKIGAEWMILSPHYIMKDWMGLTDEKGSTEDPRCYVQTLRKFCAEHGIALADGSEKYSHLWLTGMPYITYMTNTINHPDRRGLKFFADALMEAMQEN